MDYGRILEALREASAFDLYRLRWAIDRELDDPRWIATVRQRVHPGQALTFFDERDNRLRSGVLLECRRKQAVVLDRESGQRWLISYAALNVEQADAHIRERAGQGLGRHEVQAGETVGFQDREGRPRTGKVLRLNDKTVTLECDQQRWRVSYGLLYRLIETS